MGKESIEMGQPNDPYKYWTEEDLMEEIRKIEQKRLDDELTDDDKEKEKELWRVLREKERERK